MYKKHDFIYDAAFRLEELINIPVEVESRKKEHDTLLTLNEKQFVIEANPEVRASNKGIVLSNLNELQERSNRPIIVIAKFIATDIAREFKEQEINYIDIAGNTFIKNQKLFIYISGQQSHKLAKTNQSRAFQEAGIKLIFNLLKTPENLQFSYRELSELTGISIGSVSNVIKELEDLNFILKTNKKRILKNTRDLLDRWIIAYNDVLKPRILKKRMRFANYKDYNSWNTLPIHEIEDINLWGGEPAAAILTGQLQPEIFTIYTNASWQNVAMKLKLVPDEKGDIEILHMFWKEKKKFREKYITPSLLVYADLISSGHERNIEIAKQLINNELQYIMKKYLIA